MPSQVVKRRRIPEQIVEGKRLGRHVHHDPRSLAFQVQPDGTVATARWPRRTPVLDQGQTSSCTGNAACGCVGTDPLYSDLAAPGVLLDELLDEAEALTLYSAAEKIDGGAGYPPQDDGSSGLSVAKAAQAAGLISGYQHITSVIGAHTAIQSGPFIVGTDWYSGFDTPDANGVVRISGTVRGGHEYECIGYDTTTDLWEFVNSWGTAFGVAGHFFYTSATFAALLAADGDATVFVPLSQPAPVPVPAPPVPVPAPLPVPASCVSRAMGAPGPSSTTVAWLENAAVRTVQAFVAGFLVVIVGAGAGLVSASVLHAAIAAGILAGASTLESLVSNVVTPGTASLSHAYRVRVSRRPRSALSSWSSPSIDG